jgi:SpoVK/Ycf46/Vps4 family AAA+-type ATPase
VDDVALRKSPRWQEMFSIRNIKKTMNHHDVLVSEGKESLKRLQANALALLDLTYTGDDLALLLEDARKGLERKSIEQIQESFDLFFALLDFQPVSLEVLERDLQIFARPKLNADAVRAFEHLILFDEKTLSLGLKKGPFSPESDSDLAWVMQYVRGLKTADLNGMDVFKFLAELALEKTQSKGGQNRVAKDK